jgi:ATP-binding cassette subfamily B multidrug efflux pump
MDRLIVLDEGRIIEAGSHADLVSQGGVYADLWTRQSGGFLADHSQEAEEAAE